MLQSRDAAVMWVVLAVLASAAVSVGASFVVAYGCNHGHTVDGSWCTSKLLVALFGPPAVAISGIALGTRPENRRAVVAAGVLTIVAVAVGLAAFAPPRAM